jgi:hypothetical protein
MDSADSPTFTQQLRASETAQLVALANRNRLQDRERRDRLIHESLRRAGKLGRTTA